MKLHKSLLIVAASVFSVAFVGSVWANSSAHDFKSQSWSGGRSCAICHVIKRGVMSPLPPGSRAVDDAHLNPQELQAVTLHASNRLCFACHQTAMDSSGGTGHSSVGDGTLPVMPDAPNLPPSEANGTRGSICIRVNSRGVKAADCLACHDVHSLNSAYFLRQDYGQAPNP